MSAAVRSGGAADINNNYWFEPLSVRDLSNLKITSEINYVRLISPGLRSVYRRARVLYRTLRDRARVCVRPAAIPLRPLRHLCPAVESCISIPSLSLVFALPNYEQRARARSASYRRYYVEHQFIRAASPPFPLCPPL